MHDLEALEQLQLLDVEQLSRLEHAHWRYLGFMGLCAMDEAHAQQALRDRQCYPQWYTHTNTGMPRVTDEGVAGFMSAIAGCPPEVCLAWYEVDFCHIQGKDYRELLARGERL